MLSIAIYDLEECFGLIHVEDSCGVKRAFGRSDTLIMEI